MVDFLGHLLFQQDGAPPNYHLGVKGFLDEHLPRSWIGRGGPTCWSPRSPALSPFDFFWGFVKDCLHITNATVLGRAMRPNLRCDCMSQCSNTTALLRRTSVSHRHLLHNSCAHWTLIGKAWSLSVCVTDVVNYKMWIVIILFILKHHVNNNKKSFCELVPCNIFTRYMVLLEHFS
jgi:hypothetical protein